MANTSIKLESSGQGTDLETTKILLGSPQAIPISLGGTPNVSQQQLNVSGIGQPQLIQTAGGQILTTATGQQFIQQPNGMLQMVQAVSFFILCSKII